MHRAVLAVLVAGAVLGLYGIARPAAHQYGARLAGHDPGRTGSPNAARCTYHPTTDTQLEADLRRSGSPVICIAGVWRGDKHGEAECGDERPEYCYRIESGPAAGTATLRPAPGKTASIIGEWIDEYASNITYEDLSMQNVIIGNFEENGGHPNPEYITLRNITGHRFQIDSARHVTIEGGAWGPSTCSMEGDDLTRAEKQKLVNWPGGNMSIREIPKDADPEYIAIRNTTIYGVQSADLYTEPNDCHIEGLAIFGGDHVSVVDDRFYDDSVFDVFEQFNYGDFEPENITIEGNWMARPTDTTGRNGEAVGQIDGQPLVMETKKNLTIRANRMNGRVELCRAEKDCDGYSGISIERNFGEENVACYAGVTFAENVWRDEKCAPSDIDLRGAQLPFVNHRNNGTLNYTLTGAYANGRRGATVRAQERNSAERYVGR